MNTAHAKTILMLINQADVITIGFDSGAEYNFESDEGPVTLEDKILGQPDRVVLEIEMDEACGDSFQVKITEKSLAESEIKPDRRIHLTDQEGYKCTLKLCQLVNIFGGSAKEEPKSSVRKAMKR